MSTREVDPADIVTVYRIFAERAVELFNERGECLPQLMALWLGDEPGMLRDVFVIDPRLVNAMQRDDQAKDSLAILIRVLLAGMAIPPLGIEESEDPPRLVAHVTEAWSLVQHDAPKDATPEEIRAAALGPHEQVKDHPQRREVIMVSIHTAARSYHGLCPVVDEAGKRVAKFEPLRNDGMWHGRFTHQQGDAQ